MQPIPTGSSNRLKTTDGLRALAIVAVVLFHTFPDFSPGGYVGVDVFFVISGFIISLTYEDRLIARKTKIQRFFVRRVARLAPAYIVLVAVISTAAIFVLSPVHLVDYALPLVFQGIYAQNLAFWNIGDYFNKPLTKPLLHTWSLAVEEQFYLFFPFFIFLVRRFPAKRNSFLAIATVTSIVIGWKISTISPKTSFYWLPTRVWEFAAGMIAAGVYQIRPVKGTSGRILVVAGSASIIGAIFQFDENSTIPGLQTALAVSGTVAVLLGQSAGFTRIYETRLAQHFGRISYSWYLWHWPPLAFYFLKSGVRPSWAVGAALALIGYGIGLASYLFIEQPLKERKWKSYEAFRLTLAFCFGSILVGSLVLEQDGLLWRYPPKKRALFAAQLDVPSYRCPLMRRLRMWNRSVCRINDIPGLPTLLIGDSHADRFKTALSSIPLFITKQNCTALEFGDRPDCNWRTIINDVKVLKVRRIILISHWEKEYTKASLSRLESNILDAGVPVIVLLPTPEGLAFDPASYLRSGRFDDFVPVTRQQVEQQTIFFRNAIESISKRNKKVILVDPLTVLCPSACRFALRGKPIYRDSNHLTLDGVTLIAPLVLKASA